MIQKQHIYNRSYSEKSKNKRKHSTGDVLLYVVFLLIVGFILSLYIGQSVKITQLNYELDNLKEKITELEEKNNEFTIELAQKSSLAKIEQVARQKIHMVEPENTEVIVLNNENEQTQPAENNNEGKMYVFQVINDIMKRVNTVMADSPH